MGRQQKTDSTKQHPPQSEEFAQNMALVAERCQQIMQEWLSRQSKELPSAAFDPLNIGAAFSELFTQLMRDPVGLLEKQFALWQDYMQLWRAETERMLGEEEKPVIEPDARDKRFRDEAWRENALFDFIKQSYLLTARWIQDTASEVKDLSPHDKHKVEFYTKQFVDAMSPSNFMLTNPEVLKATLESKGENLVRGLSNMLEDMERGDGKLRISMTDMGAFEVGKNLAVTPGKVIYQNDLMQLIQYEPSTKEAHKTPLLMIPAWINKYYILDLQPENSLAKWLVDQGHTVFMVSWVNPNEKLAKKTFDDYMALGPLAAMDAIKKATGEDEISIMAYCLGGTLTASTLAWLKAKKQSNRVKSVTYLTTMVDFKEAGDLSVFIDEEQLKALENKMSEHGYLEGSEMAMTFNMLRANDLIWSFVVNNYLLGKDPFPFDLLYWNSDATRMPAAMHSFYLRNMYQRNLLSKPGALNIGGVDIDLRTVDTPTYMLSTREDHIAPWKSTYAGTQIYSGEVRFVLAASGHIAGVINPPEKKKYSHWISSSLPPRAGGDTEGGKSKRHAPTLPSPASGRGKYILPPSPKEWLAEATEHQGSWWPDWQKWQQKFAGEKIAARKPKNTIEDAPGSYVKVMV
jgi:polyhydroxyalkanoate synthase